MYQVAVQKLFGSVGTQQWGLESLLLPETFHAFANRLRLYPPFNFSDTLKQTGVSKSPKENPSFADFGIVKFSKGFFFALKLGFLVDQPVVFGFCFLTVVLWDYETFFQLVFIEAPLHFPNESNPIF